MVTQTSACNGRLKHLSSQLTSEGVKYKKGELPMETRLFIDGDFIEATSDKYIATIDPSTEEVITEIREASDADVDKAVGAATRAFETWRCVDGHTRRNMLNRLADLIEYHKDQLAYIESLDNGMPVSVAVNVQMKLVVDTYRYFAGWADKMQGKTVPIQSLAESGNHQYLCFTKHEPVGVVGQIIPWNFPLLMMAWKIAPAMATGCAVVLKTSEKTPLSALMLASLIVEAGFPRGVINILSGHGFTVGDAIVRHPGIAKVAFTGSVTTGQKVAVRAAQSGLKRTTLELGGKSPLIVFGDANIDQAVEVAQLGLFFNAGQCCIASSRVFVEESVYDKFLEKVIARAKLAHLTSPQDPRCTQGPQIDQIQRNAIMEYIQIGKREGATIVAGGNSVEGKGFWIEPTIFTDVTDDMTIAKEEIFGPVMSILKFKTIDEVVRRANGTHFGLGAGICTPNLSKAYRVMQNLRAGTVYVNCYNVFDPAAPFGGFKQSGLGRELGEYGLNAYTEIKTVITDLSAQD